MDYNIQLYDSQHSNRNIFNKFTLRLKTANRQKSSAYTQNYNNNTQTGESDSVSKFALATGGTVLIAGGGILMFSKGFQKNAGKTLNKLKEHLEYKLKLSSFNESKTAKIYDYSIKRINSFIKKSESINNITSAKDILFMKLMYKTKPTRKIHDAITNIFENLSRKTVINSYKKTTKRFDKMNEIIDKLDEYILKNSADEVVEYNGEKYTRRELVEKAKSHRDIAKIAVTSFMSKNAMQTRYNEISDITANLYSKFWDVSFKDFWTKNNKFKRKEMWQTFIAAEQIKADKIKLSGKVALVRSVLTNDAERTQMMLNHIKDIEEILLPTDTKGIELVNKLKWLIDNPEVYKNNKDKFLADLKQLKQHDIILNSDPSITEAYAHIKETQISILEELAMEEATGEIQDMMSIYYKIAPFEFVKSGAELSIKQAVSSFDKSINLETAEFFDKVRDLKLGSAPTDILTIMLSCGMITYGLSYAKDKEQRLSVMLKSGIPIAGAVATSLISATKLISGGKSLALGAISGIILNKMGVIADNLRKANKHHELSS
jgi:hypothetical protein